jgi:hypothetical protein
MSNWKETTMKQHSPGRLFIILCASAALTLAGGCGGSSDQAGGAASAPETAAAAADSDALSPSIVDTVSSDSISMENAEEILKKLEAEINSTESF